MRSLNSVSDMCKNNNISLIISHANKQPLSVMKKSGFYDAVGDDRFVANIDEALMLAENLI